MLDVGTGTTAWPHLLRNCGYVVTAIDNIRDHWPEGMVNRHWAVLDVDIVKPDPRIPEKCEAITCISVLEHIENHTRAVWNMVAFENRWPLDPHDPFSHDNPHPNVYTRADALWRQGSSVHLSIIFRDRIASVNLITLCVTCHREWHGD